MTDLDVLKEAFDKIGIEYDIIMSPFDKENQIIDLDDERMSHSYNESIQFEFDKVGKLVKLSGSGE